MKSVIITIIMFAGLYVIINSDVLGFLGQKSVLYFSIGAALCMLLTAVISNFDITFLIFSSLYEYLKIIYKKYYYTYDKVFDKHLDKFCTSNKSLISCKQIY